MIHADDAVLHAGHGARDLGSEGIGLQTGRSVIDVRTADKSARAFGVYERVTFHAKTAASCVGRPATLRVTYQDVPVFKARLYLPSEWTFTAPLRRFQAPSALAFHLELHEPPDRVFGSFDEFTTDTWSITKVTREAATDELGLRWQLVDAAALIASNLRLKGDYLANGRGQRLVDTICQRLRDRQPYSLVRIGDGEGRVLGYADIFTESEALSQVLYYQFGPESMNKIKAQNPQGWIRDSMAELNTMVADALENADAVGLPVSEYFAQRSPERAHGLLGYAAGLLCSMPKIARLSEDDIYGANVFQRLAISGALFRPAAQAARSVVIVGPWDISEGIAGALGVSSVDWIRVPGHYTWRGERGYGQFPDLYRFVERSIQERRDLSGSLVLVGAGVLGKHYCRIVKNLGGVALDVGAVLDSWAGKGRPDAVAQTQISIARIGS